AWGSGQFGVLENIHLVSFEELLRGVVAAVHPGLAAIRVEHLAQRVDELRLRSLVALQFRCQSTQLLELLELAWFVENLRRPVDRLIHGLLRPRRLDRAE